MVIPAKLVRAIGGPMGPAVGPMGPVGFPSVLIAGAMGRLGPPGRPGVTGPAGLAGIAAGLMGPTGFKGPTGSKGHTGPTGSTGTGAVCPNNDYFRYYENVQGYKNFTNGGNYVGCKFLYTIKESGYTFVLFTGKYKSTGALEFVVGAYMGGYANAESAPNPGDRSLGAEAGIGGNMGRGYTNLIAPADTVLPFFILVMAQVTHYATDPNPFPMHRWFDLAATYGGNGFPPPGGEITNIACSIFEIPNGFTSAEDEGEEEEEVT